jgi:hypothetical protein
MTQHDCLSWNEAVRAAGSMGTLDEATFQKVIKAIGYVIKSDCKPL